ncbi:MAG: hypothetical protein EXS05_17995 [Planctomycetaceae bacterium]|nr:hypothetical protein [Planctomycetaceae bacterium]
MLANDFQVLLAKVRAGDPDAVNRWFKEYRPVAAGAANRLLKGNELQRRIDSSDVAQEVLTRALEKLQAGNFEIASPERMGALVRTMSCQYVIDEGRRFKVRGGATNVYINTAAAGADLDQDFIEDSGSTPSHKARRNEAFNQVRARLPPEFQLVCDMRRDEWSWKDIAAALGMDQHKLEVDFYRFARKPRPRGQVANPSDSDAEAT